MVNTVILEGEIASEVRYYEGNPPMARSRIRTENSKGYSNYHTIKGWNDRAEDLSELSEGDRAVVEGRLQHENYEKDGQKRVETYIKINSVCKV